MDEWKQVNQYWGVFTFGHAQDTNTLVDLNVPLETLLIFYNVAKSQSRSRKLSKHVRNVRCQLHGGLVLLFQEFQVLNLLRENPPHED